MKVLTIKKKHATMACARERYRTNVTWWRPRRILEAPSLEFISNMWETDQFDLDTEQQEMFRNWNELYPVTDWECERDKLIAGEQGERNRNAKEKFTKASF